MQYLCNTSFCQFVILKARLTAPGNLKKNQACNKHVFSPIPFFLVFPTSPTPLQKITPAFVFLKLSYFWEVSGEIEAAQQEHMKM